MGCPASAIEAARSAPGMLVVLMVGAGLDAESAVPELHAMHAQGGLHRVLTTEDDASKAAREPRIRIGGELYRVNVAAIHEDVPKIILCDVDG